jgi:hypothetical protein
MHHPPPAIVHRVLRSADGACSFDLHLPAFANFTRIGFDDSWVPADASLLNRCAAYRRENEVKSLEMDTYVRLGVQRPDIVSAAVAEVSFQVPSAHPGWYYWARTIDPRTGALIPLARMLRLDRLARLRVVAQHNIASFDDDTFGPMDDPPTILDHLTAQDVLVRADGITLLNAYDYYAAHALVVRFTRAQLRAAGVIRPDGPLAFLLRP